MHVLMNDIFSSDVDIARTNFYDKNLDSDKLSYESKRPLNITVNLQ